MTECYGNSNTIETKFVPYTSGNWSGNILQVLGVTKRNALFGVSIEKIDMTKLEPDKNKNM